VFSLYVDPDAQGGGVGRRLLGKRMLVRGPGARGGDAWVFEANAPARTFYALHGWLPDGATRVEPDFGEPEVRLRRSVESPGDSGP